MSLEAPKIGLKIGRIVSVSLSRRYRFSKPPALQIHLLAGLGVEGDAHCGTTVKHRHRVRQDPTQPNLRQVHLLHEELFAELAAAGFEVHPGEMGENVTTRGLDLLGLPAGTLLHLGEDAVVEVTGLRSPCVQIDRFQPGLLQAVVGKDRSGETVRKTGIMSIVRAGGALRPGDRILAELPEPPWRALVCV